MGPGRRLSTRRPTSSFATSSRRNSRREGPPMRSRTWFVLAVLLAWPSYVGAAERPIVIGCKQDVEGQVLAEIMAQLLEDRGFAVERRFSLGGTLICFEALKRGSIDVYPEYSGTVEQAILQLPGRV